MQNIKIATAQFEHWSGDKDYNLRVIEKLSAQAAHEGADAIAFHECSITGYTFARHLSREELFDLAEEVPNGPSTKRLQQIAQQHHLHPEHSDARLARLRGKREAHDGDR